MEGKKEASGRHNAVTYAGAIAWLADMAEHDARFIAEADMRSSTVAEREAYFTLKHSVEDRAGCRAIDIAMLFGADLHDVKADLAEEREERQRGRS